MKRKFKDYLVVAKVIGTFALLAVTIYLSIYCYAYGITFETLF